jgi:nucleotide-binding universal stress UspA family protein
MTHLSPVSFTIGLEGSGSRGDSATENSTKQEGIRVSEFWHIYCSSFTAGTKETLKDIFERNFEASDSEGGEGMTKKILVATDGSDHSMKAVNKALDLAQKSEVDITLMSVAYYATEDFDEMPFKIQERLEAQAKTALEKAKALFDEKGIKVETVLEAGFVPANNIIRKAEEGKFDEIIMGSTGISGLKRILIGSTAAKIVEHAPCCVTVIR